MNLSHFRIGMGAQRCAIQRCGGQVVRGTLGIPLTVTSLAEELEAASQVEAAPRVHRVTDSAVPPRPFNKSPGLIRSVDVSSCSASCAAVCPHLPMLPSARHSAPSCRQIHLIRHFSHALLPIIRYACSLHGSRRATQCVCVARTHTIFMPSMMCV